ncbi:MAG TPA: pyridoxal-dependent decarboxylase [Candidatus Limnocylindrales bacterium]
MTDTRETDTGVDLEQSAGLADMDPESFRRAGHEVVDLLADYLAHVERFAVFPPIEPGSLRPSFASMAPEEPEPMAAILDDYRRLVEPNVTHWQHPGFLAYFPTTASGPGIIGEMLTAGIGSNAMLWRTSPVATELEEVVVDWLRQAFGLPDAFDGLLTDTASISSLAALAAARESVGVGAVDGSPDAGRPRVYASTEAHSSIDKACMTLGLGRDAVVKVEANIRYEMRPEALDEAIRHGREAGQLPMAIVATIGTTSSTSADPIGPIADIAERERIWLHIDAAYAGSAAIIPERRQPFVGWERADSIVVNPHKWLFTPLDASLLLTRRMPALHAAFSLVPEYLRTLDRETPVRDYNEYVPQLGRRFRALKLWVQLRWFGLEGLRRRIERHIELAQQFAGWVDSDPDWERLAPVPFSTVCFRYRPRALAGREAERDLAARLDRANELLMDRVNRSGEVFLSHTRLRDRFTIRVAIANLRTEPRHVAQAWELLRREATRIDV